MTADPRDTLAAIRANRRNDGSPRTLGDFVRDRDALLTFAEAVLDRADLWESEADAVNDDAASYVAFAACATRRMVTLELRALARKHLTEEEQ